MHGHDGPGLLGHSYDKPVNKQQGTFSKKHPCCQKFPSSSKLKPSPGELPGIPDRGGAEGKSQQANQMCQFTYNLRFGGGRAILCDLLTLRQSTSDGKFDQCIGLYFLFHS